jgi:two-component system response regulator NreC
MSGVIIIEDHLMFQDVLRTLVEDTLNLKLMGVSATGSDGIALFAENKPDVVLLDLDLPDMDGFTVTNEILKIDPHVRILAISSLSDEFTLFRVLRSGLFGFVDKTTERIETVAHALQEVLEWRPFYSAGVYQFNLIQQADPRSFPKILTLREQELMCYFGVGLHNDAIAAKLKLSAMTVQSHRRNIMSKLGLQSTPDLIRYALAKGFTQVSRIRQDDPAES